MRKDTEPFRPEALPEGMIEGRNAVTEAIRSGRTINKVFLADGDTDRALGRLAAMAKDDGEVVVRIDRRKLNEMSPTRIRASSPRSPRTNTRRSTTFSPPPRAEGKRRCSSSATSFPTRTTSARSCARPNAPARTASSSPSGAASA